MLLLKGTNLDFNKVKLDSVYNASEDGWSAIDFHKCNFHKCVNRRRSSLIVALSKSRKLFGGRHVFWLHVFLVLIHYGSYRRMIMGIVILHGFDFILRIGIQRFSGW